MYKHIVYVFMFLMVSLMVGCNESSLEPEDQNIQPENVGFGGQNDGGNQGEIPVNPGREQNIFENANPNEWYRQEDRNYGADSKQRQTTQEKQQTTEQNQQTEQQDDDYIDQNEEPESFDRESLDGVIQKVVELTNQARSENGADSLKFDHELANVAQTKSEDMAERDYFSHTSPQYGSPFDMLQEFGVDYTKASENIAAGQESAEEVVQAWLDSEGHRKNLLDPEVTHIGVGFATDGNYWTQLFIKK
ncbi:CAP domain-containing protein [Gracilibacillus lacisalsi]|uniref:CAP domain-containing protein n=1 Tax=Gracilibacillus lacisalsi TaxID=393087 RepID=UPI00036D1B75|nr:CAP domain-containing protein [Gracilibacillus lacisalsi]